MASTLRKYDLKKGDLFVLRWTLVRESIPSGLLMCGGSVRSILLLPLVARCLATIHGMYMVHVCFYVCSSGCVRGCGNVGMFVA